MLPQDPASGSRPAPSPGGWIALHRRLAYHSIWIGERFTRGQAWVDLLLEAAYQDHEAILGSVVVPVRRGQVLTSQVALAARWRWNRRTVRCFLHVLQRLMMITIGTSKRTEAGYTLVTILNYDLYQTNGHPDAGGAFPIVVPIRVSSESPSSAHPMPTPNKGKKGNKNDTAGGAAAAPHHQRVIDAYVAGFTEKIGTPPVLSGGRDGKIVADLLRDRTRVLRDADKAMEEILVLLRGFFRTGTLWVRRNGSYTLPIFKTSFNELLVMRQRGEL